MTRPLASLTLPLALAAFAGPAAAEALADDPMTAPAAGPMAADVDTGSANMVGGWSGQGLAFAAPSNGGGLTGAGSATRGLGVQIDFSAEAEWFFRVEIERDAANQPGSDYATMVLYNNDRSVSNRPVTVGVSSGDTFLLNLTKEARADLDAKAAAGVANVFACRLRTHADGPDELDLWVLPAGEAAPTSPPAEPDASLTADYGRAAGQIRLQTGNAPHATATFRNFRLATTWESLFAEDPEIDDAAALHTYREFEHLRLEPDATRILPAQWANVSLLPNAAGEAPDVLVAGTHAWVPHRSVLHRPVDAARRAAASPAPNADLPLYDGGDPDHGIRRARHLPVPDGRGGWELIDQNRLELLGTVTAAGERTLLDKPVHLGLTPAEPGQDRKQTLRALQQRSNFFVGDADGDGVPDLLIGRQRDPQEQGRRWPDGGSPWTLESQPLVGPHLDTENTDGYRGYDVAGNWLGGEMTKQLNWCRGTRDGANGTLSFGPETPVHLGRDDEPVTWRNDDKELTPALVERDGQTFVVLFSAVDQVLALPVLGGSDPGTLALGRATPLLGDNPTGVLILPDVFAVMDVTGDGLDDLIVGNGSSGRVGVYSGPAVGDFRYVGPLECVGGVVSADTLGVPSLGDWDGDGRNDLMLGDSVGHYSWYAGTDDPRVFGGQRFLTDGDGEPRRYVGTRNLQGHQERGWGYTQAELFDWDRDGTPDLIGNDNTSTLRLHRRTDPADARVVSDNVFEKDGSKLGVAWRHRPAGLPGSMGLAGDDRPVLLYLNLALDLVAGVPVSTGATEIEREVPLLYEDGSSIRTSGSAGMSGRTVLNAADWDGDGLWDVVFGVVAKNVEAFNPDPLDQATTAGLKSSSAFWLKNVGTASEPVFEKPRRITWKDGGVTRVETHGFALEPTDLDGDGELDLIFGDGPGFFFSIDRDDLAWD